MIGIQFKTICCTWNCLLFFRPPEKSLCRKFKSCILTFMVDNLSSKYLIYFFIYFIYSYFLFNVLTKSGLQLIKTNLTITLNVEFWKILKDFSLLDKNRYIKIYISEAATKADLVKTSPKKLSETFKVMTDRNNRQVTEHFFMTTFHIFLLGSVH